MISFSNGNDYWYKKITWQSHVISFHGNQLRMDTVLCAVNGKCVKESLLTV